MVQFPGYSYVILFYSYDVDCIAAAGLPHSVVHGSQDMCSSPWLFAACHEYLALEDGPPIFRQDFSCPALLVARSDPPPAFCIRDYHPVSSDFPDRFAKLMV